MKRILLMFGVLACCTISYGQLSYTFETGGAIGQNGPTQVAINTAYTGTSLAGQVTVTGGIQYWVVPQTGVYSIDALGAQGYGAFGGRGASMYGEFALTAGDTLKILVGQKGAPPVGSGTNQYGGGGGSFVTDLNNTPLIVAGGGGGSWAAAFTSTTDASVSQAGISGANGFSATYNGAGGINGLGGDGLQNAGGGAGLLGDGVTNIAGGDAFINGGAGGKAAASGGEGGFGGGGGASSWDNRRCGGGGGYSGGGGAAYNSASAGFPEGGGGGSFNSGTNPVNVAGANIGDGQVIITSLNTNLCNAPLSVTSNVVVCDSVIVDWTGAADSAIVSYVATGGTPTGGILVVGDSTYTITGTSAMMTYDVYVANICMGDTAIGGPYTFSTLNIGAPVASFSWNSPGWNLSVVFDGGGSAGNGNTYAWDFGDGTTGTGINPNHTFTSGGAHTIQLTVTNACGSDDTTITVANVSIGENELSNNMMIFPNPASNVLNIELSSNGGDHIGIRIMDISGKEMMNISEVKTSIKYEGRVDVSNLAQGVYMMEVTDGKYTAVRRLIIE